MNLVFGIRKNNREYVSRIALAGTLREALEESRARRLHVWSKKTGNPDLARRFSAGIMFDKGRDGFNTKALSWTADTQKAMLLDTTATGTWLKAITAASNANPVVYSSTAHGFSNNDVLCTFGIGGNLCANQTGLAASVATNTFDLNTLEGLAVAGNAAYTSGGVALDLTQATFVADILGTRISTDQTLAGTTSSRGVANATSPVTWTAVPAGNPAVAVVLYDAAGGSDAANRLIAWQDGRVRVVVNTAVVATATTISVEPLRAQLWDGVTGSAPILYWSDGHTSTLNASAAQGARSLTITSQATGGVAIGSTADALDFGGGLPVTPSGGNISLTIGTIYAPTTPTGLYKL